jgi:hypothetical protein
MISVSTPRNSRISPPTISTDIDLIPKIPISNLFSLVNAGIKIKSARLEKTMKPKPIQMASHPAISAGK